MEKILTNQFENNVPKNIEAVDKAASAVLDKKVYHNTFTTYKNRKLYKGKLSIGLSNGLTVSEQLDKQDNWINELTGQDLANYMKLFAYFNQVRKQFSEDTLPRLVFSVKTDDNFWSHFLKKKKKGKNRADAYCYRDKKTFLNWLYTRQTEFDYLMERNGKIYLEKVRFYKMAEEVCPDNFPKELRFSVNTDFLNKEFNDYLEVPLALFQQIEDQFESWKESPEFIKFNNQYPISNFTDVFIKFFLLLKTIYNRRPTKTLDSGYICNSQTLSAAHFRERIGNLRTRAYQGFRKRNITTVQESQLITDYLEFVIKKTFEVATNLGWLFSKPKKKNGNFVFNFSAAFFDKKKTAKQLEENG